MPEMNLQKSDFSLSLSPTRLVAFLESKLGEGSGPVTLDSKSSLHCKRDGLSFMVIDPKKEIAARYNDKGEFAEAFKVEDGQRVRQSDQPAREEIRKSVGRSLFDAFVLLNLTEYLNSSSLDYFKDPDLKLRPRSDIFDGKKGRLPLVSHRGYYPSLSDWTDAQDFSVKHKHFHSKMAPEERIRILKGLAAVGSDGVQSQFTRYEATAIPDGGYLFKVFDLSIKSFIFQMSFDANGNKANIPSSPGASIKGQLSGSLADFWLEMASKYLEANLVPSGQN